NPSLNRAPEAFYVAYAALDFSQGQRGAEFEDFDVVRFDQRREGREIHFASAGGAVVAPRELDIVDVEPGQPVAQGFEMKEMIDESQVLLDLRVAGVVPINQGGTVHFLE